jgi:hypothetical protein
MDTKDTKEKTFTDLTFVSFVSFVVTRRWNHHVPRYVLYPKGLNRSGT